MLKHLNSHALLEVRPKLYCSSTLCGSASVGNRVIPLDNKSFFFFRLHFDDDRTGNVRQIMPLFNMTTVF